MFEIRQRRIPTADHGFVRLSSVDNCYDEESGRREEEVNEEAEEVGSPPDHLRRLWTLSGVVMAMFVIYGYLRYLHVLHDTTALEHMEEVEREISFRTESGLYYSYYKQLVHAPSFAEGMHLLTHDNLTEHPNEINIVQRMNVYQEIILAFLYRNLPFVQQEPIFFYIGSIFALHGLLVGSLYSLSWQLSGSWLTGLLTTILYIFNKEDATRVNYVVPLRESFSLPFLWLQLAILTSYLKRGGSKISQISCLMGLSVATICFTVTWQFSQFILLLQALTLFSLHILGFIPKAKASSVLFVQAYSLVIVWWLQFYQPMMLTSPVLSFIPAALVIINVSSGAGRISQCVTQGTAVVMLTWLINATLKFLSRHDADEHIFNFLKAKFGFCNPVDLDVQLYMCNAAFSFLTWDVIQRLTTSGLLPLYVIAQCYFVAEIILVYLRHRSRRSRHNSRDFEEEDCFHSELVYNVAQPLSFAVMALVVLRMKYLWTPYMAILASVALSYQPIYAAVLKKLKISSPGFIQLSRHLVLLFALAAICQRALPKAWNELKDLREFHDPDTVDLMRWIQSETAQDAAFSGSMQLMAAVKLSTGRPITNHPHFEDKSLRIRTSQLYQMYGRYPPASIHAILGHYGASYMILEDTICMAGNRGDGCRLIDLVDVGNGMMPEGGASFKWPENLAISAVPRFCDAIRKNTPNFLHFFKLVHSSRTFRVYKLLPR